MDQLSRLWFALVGAILILLASGLVIAGMYQVATSILSAGEFINQRLLSAVGYVVIAVLLEAIVLIFKMAEDDVSLMIYPTILLLAGVAMLVGLGIFQRMAVSAEHETGEHEDDQKSGKAKSASPKSL